MHIYQGAHIHYARYCFYYFDRQMLDRLYVRGEHVMRHRRGISNGIRLDEFIDRQGIYIDKSYGKGPRGIIVITLNPSAVKRWANTLMFQIQLHMTDKLYENIR